VPCQRINTCGKVETGLWRFGVGESIWLSGATVVAVNERVTTGERPPTLSTARMTNVRVPRDDARTRGRKRVGWNRRRQRERELVLRGRGPERVALDGRVDRVDEALDLPVGIERRPRQRDNELGRPRAGAR
jgi:hypothetical protein